MSGGNDLGLMLVRHRGDLVCIGGPCAGLRVKDGGLPAVRIPAPPPANRDFRWEDKPGEMVTYERRVINGSMVVLALPGVTAEDVLGELIKGYHPHVRRFADPAL